MALERSSLHSGPLPHPELLQQYEQVQPGFAERIVSMTEKEGEHRRDINRTFVRRSFNAARLGMWFGLSSVLAVVSLCFYCLYLGHAKEAATIAVGVLASLATVFVWGRRSLPKGEAKTNND